MWCHWWNAKCSQFGQVRSLPQKLTHMFTRTTVSIQAGATSRASVFINCVCVLIISLVLLPVFDHLPLPVIASIHMIVAVRMVKVENFKLLWNMNRTNFFLSIATAILCVVMNAVTGILIGCVIALLLFCKELAKG